MSRDTYEDYTVKIGDRVAVNLGGADEVPRQPIRGTIVGVIGQVGVQVRWDDEQVTSVHVCDIDSFTRS